MIFPRGDCVWLPWCSRKEKILFNRISSRRETKFERSTMLRINSTDLSAILNLSSASFIYSKSHPDPASPTQDLNPFFRLSHHLSGRRIKINRNWTKTTESWTSSSKRKPLSKLWKPIHRQHRARSEFQSLFRFDTNKCPISNIWKSDSSSGQWSSPLAMLLSTTSSVITSKSLSQRKVEITVQEGSPSIEVGTSIMCTVRISSGETLFMFNLQMIHEWW